jgi:general secretion pathway protein A
VLAKNAELSSMYEEHWKLARRPFENRYESETYYPSETHQAALLKLHYAIENRRASAMLCGPAGMGKTLLLESLRRQLSEDFRPIVSLVFPPLPQEQLVRYLVDRLDGKQAESVREASFDLWRFETFMENNIKAGRHAVVLVDEAQLLEEHALLEPLRLLLNVAVNESGGESAWTLVLVGQPTLLAHVERNPALDERLAVKCMLNRFTTEETIAYVQHRLRVAGADAESIFDYPALERIQVLTQGIPRRINRLCDLALMVGYADDQGRIGVDVVDSVHSDLVSTHLG